MLSKNFLKTKQLSLVRAVVKNFIKKKSTASQNRSKIEYKIITEDYYDKALQHLRDTFYADEPLNKAVNLVKRGESHPYTDDYCNKTLKENLSIMAINDQKQIVGVLLNGTEKLGDNELVTKQIEEVGDENFKKIFRLMLDLNARAKIFEKFDLYKLFEMRILSVNSCISNGLVKESEKLAKCQHFKLLKAAPTGFYSQQVFVSNGFLALNEISYKDWLDESGNLIFKIEPPHEKVQLCYKLLC